ncbi:MAG: 50S ribosomal protein L31 [Patescibacteria group bacterium]
MKLKIHPQYNSEVKVVCSACGNAFTTGSTKENISVEVCYKCHPFYTGEHRFLDTQGRVESFKQKQEAAKKYKATFSSKKTLKDEKKARETKSLRELLAEA